VLAEAKKTCRRKKLKTIRKCDTLLNLIPSRFSVSLKAYRFAGFSAVKQLQEEAWAKSADSSQAEGKSEKKRLKE
jgi:hypothetical protein